MSDRAAWYERRSRRAKLARTHVRHAVEFLWGRGGDPVPTSYWDLLDACLAAAADIAEQLPDDFFETRRSDDPLGLGLGDLMSSTHNLSDGPLEAALKVVEALRARRAAGERATRITKLESVEGRTPEEAALYLAKAAELKGAPPGTRRGARP